MFPLPTILFYEPLILFLFPSTLLESPLIKDYEPNILLRSPLIWFLLPSAKFLNPLKKLSNPFTLLKAPNIVFRFPSITTLPGPCMSLSLSLNSGAL